MGLTKPRAAQIYNLDYKQATRVVTVAAVTLAGGAPNTVDGVNLSLDDRVLVTAQGTASQNGLYRVTTVGAGSNGTWARTSDGNETGEIEAGMLVMVTEGSIYADTQWKLTTDDPIVIGTTTLTFVQNYSANSISSGTSNVTVLTNSNVTISSAGTANVVLVSSTGIVVAGNIVPSANITYSLGTTSQRFSNLWLSNTTIYLGDINLSATETTLTVNGANVLVGNAGAAFSTSGNITGGNVLTDGLISATGNITGNYFLGNVFYANGITASKIYNGNSEVNVTASGGNVNVSIGGTSNVALFTTDGEYVTGLLSVSGNVTGGNVLTAGLISATGNATGGNINTAGLISATGNITGNYFLGNVACASGIFATKIFSGTTEANIVSANGNLAISVGGTSNVAVFATTGEYVTGLLSVTGNTTFGNVLTGGLVSATANVTGGNILTGGLVSATGNVTGGYLLGNASQVTGVSTFNQIFVTGATTVNAASLTSNVTFTGGANIALTSNGNTITIAYSAAGSDSIFATGGDMGLIVNPVTESEDLGTVIVVADTSYDLGALFVTETFNQIDMTGFTANVNTGNLNAVGLISAAGNITGAYIFGNGSQLTGVVASATFPLANGTSNINGVANGNITVGIAGTANVAVFSTSGITANNFYGNGAALTGITSTPPPLNINLQQNYGGF
jgi:hypothetical protein